MEATPTHKSSLGQGDEIHTMPYPQCHTHTMPHPQGQEMFTHRCNVVYLEGMVKLQLFVQVLLRPHGKEEGRLVRYLAHVVVPSRREHTCDNMSAHDDTRRYQVPDDMPTYGEVAEAHNDTIEPEVPE